MATMRGLDDYIDISPLVYYDMKAYLYGDWYSSSGNYMWLDVYKRQAQGRGDGRGHGGAAVSEKEEYDEDSGFWRRDVDERL